MLLIHPIIQIVATLIAFYSLFLGFSRFRTLHLGKRGVFAWNRHVLVGKTALLLWTAGLFGGAAVTWLNTGSAFNPTPHANTALAMLPLIAFGFFTGVYMDKHKTQRKLLPMLHGLGNVVLLVLAGSQFFTGSRIVQAILGN